MDQIQLTSQVRTGTGKGVARKLRREGLVPAVMYGGEHGNMSLSVNSHDLRQILAKGGAEHSLITLSVEKENERQDVSVILKDYQLHPVKRTFVHVDFMEVTKGQALEIAVPIELVGTAPGVKEGGTMEFVTREISIECLPSKMLDHIDVDIASLQIGDSISVGEITLSDDHKLLTSPESVVVTIAAPRGEEAEGAEEEVAEPEVIQKGKKEE